MYLSLHVRGKTIDVHGMGLRTMSPQLSVFPIFGTDERIFFPHGLLSWPGMKMFRDRPHNHLRSVGSRAAFQIPFVFLMRSIVSAILSEMPKLWTSSSINITRKMQRKRIGIAKMTNSTSCSMLILFPFIFVRYWRNVPSGRSHSNLRHTNPLPQASWHFR